MYVWGGVMVIVLEALSCTSVVHCQTWYDRQGRVPVFRSSDAADAGSRTYALAPPPPTLPIQVSNFSASGITQTASK
jgi:hypothetical protein